MLEITSQIATLKQDGKQVGGLYDVDIRVILQYTTVDGFRDYKPIKKISALSYWILEPITINVFEAEFFQSMNSQLVTMDAGKVAIDFPDTRTLDRRQYAPVEVRWLGDNEH